MKLNAKGEAHVKVPLNDSISSFRIVAVASSGLGRFGTGASSIRSTQDLMMFSGVPPLVREGDHFPAEFTLRNSTAHPMDVEVAGKIAGVAGPRQSLQLAAGEARVVHWDVQVPMGVEA